jgi:lipoprotein signal peptidase
MVNCGYFLAHFISIERYILIVLVLLVFVLFAARSNPAGYLLIFTGGIYNLIGRIGDGCVTDHFNFFNLFSFNGADVLIVVGFVIVLKKHLFKTSHLPHSIW